MSFGSEMSGGIENVTVKDIFFDDANHGTYLKYSDTRGGYLKNIHFENVVLGTIKQVAISITSAYGSPNPSCPDPPKQNVSTEVSNITFVNISQHPSTKSRYLLELHGLKHSEITGVSLNDIHLNYNKAIFDCEYASGVFHDAPGAEQCDLLKPIKI